MWKGKLVLKGVAAPGDAEMAIRLGLDGIIVSNHGGHVYVESAVGVGTTVHVVLPVEG